MALRSWVKRLEHDARGDVDSFELLDGTIFRYDRRQTNKELYLHAFDLQLGVSEWSEPPEIYLKICQAKDPQAALKQLRPEDPQRAFVNPAALYDIDILVNERRLVPLYHPPVDDLSE